MIDMTPPDTMPRPIMRTLADYLMSCVLAFAAFFVLFRAMSGVSDLLLGAPSSHQPTTFYLAIAGVSVAFADPLGLFQRRDGWRLHLRGAGVVWLLSFGSALIYFTIFGV